MNDAAVLPCALGLERLAAVFRQQPADFVVEEIPGFELTGDGEHLWVQVEKTGLNTVDVVRELARLSGTREKDIGYAGLKDKHAVAVQWFSVPCEAMPEHDTMKPGLRILHQARNAKKLRRGSHAGNRFVITLRAVAVNDIPLDHWRSQIATRGVPNYFGPQRFGHNGANLAKAGALFAGRSDRVSRYNRGLYLSAARAYLFNRVLAARVRDGTWDHYLPGDVMALQGSGSFFRTDAGDGQLAKRLADADIHPTGPLWGEGDPVSSDTVQALESGIAAENADFAAGLVDAGLTQERRPLRVMPEAFSIQPAGNDRLVVEFSLPAGAYATSVLREMVTAVGL